MAYRPKNYGTDGGNTTVINGKLEFGPNAEVENMPDVGGGAVESVNGQTGTVTLGAADVGALADDYAPAWGDVTGKPSFGTAAQADTGDFATAAQGALADSAVQSGDLAAVATSGAYGDLTGTPQGTAVANAVDETDIIDQFNGLLASLRTAGLIAS